MDIEHQSLSPIMMKYFWQAVSIFGGLSAVLIAVSGFISNMLLQRSILRIQNKNSKDVEAYKSAIAQENNKEIEAIKAILTQNNAFVSGLSTNNSATYQKLISKRLEVVENYWKCILKAKESVPSCVVLVYDLLPDKEITIRGINKGNSLGGLLSNVSMQDDTMKMMKASQEIDLQKPFISSKLWILKYSYMAVLGRSMHLLVDGYQKGGEIISWKKDEMMIQHMKFVLTDSEIAYATSLPFSGIKYVSELIENKIIDEIRRFISNDDFVNESTEQFKKIDQLVKRDVVNPIS